MTEAVYLAIFFSVLSGIAKAARDTIAHHWTRSVFIDIENARWRTWIRSDWLDKPNHIIFFLWDGWHFSDSIHVISTLVCVAVAPQMFFYVIPIIGITFQIFYKIVFLKS